MRIKGREDGRKTVQERQVGVISLFCYDKKLKFSQEVGWLTRYHTGDN